jgi:hypothetical protein
VKEVGPVKRTMLLINKADFLTDEFRLVARAGVHATCAVVVTVLLRALAAGSLGARTSTPLAWSSCSSRPRLSSSGWTRWSAK